MRAEFNSVLLGRIYSALCFAGYVMETTRQQGGGKDNLEDHCVMYEDGRARSGLVPFALTIATLVVRTEATTNWQAGRCWPLPSVSMYGCSHGGPEIQLGSLLLKLEETGDVLPVLRDYLEENRYEDCLLILEGSFRGFNHATTRPRSEDKPKEVHSDNPPANFTSLFAH
jgi:hypothetical protein